MPFSDLLFGDRVEADKAAADRLVELEFLGVRALRVNNVDRVVVRFKLCAPLLRCVQVFVQVPDTREVNCLSTFFFSKPTGTSLPALMAVSYFASPI